MTLTLRTASIAIIAMTLALFTFVSSARAADHWVEQDLSSYTGGIFDVKILSANKAVAVGDTGQAFYTDNYGQTWNTSSSGTFDDLNALDAYSIANVVTVGDNGTILTSADEGASWTSHTIATSEDYNDVLMVTSTTGYLVGSNGTIMKTTDSGASWTSQTSGTSSDLYAISCATSNICWAVGDNGMIRKTSDGGTLWVYQGSGTTEMLTDVEFTSISTGYAVGFNGTVIKTTNGMIWSNVSVSGITTESVLAVEMLSNNAIGLLSFHKLFMSEDGGTTWDETEFSSDWLYVFDWYATNVMMIAGTDSVLDSLLYAYDAEPPTDPTNLAVVGGDPINTQQPTISWDASTDNDGIERYKIKFDSDLWMTELTTSYTIGGALSEGEHTVYLYAEDHAGNQSNTVELDFTVDTTGPSVAGVDQSSTIRGEAIDLSVYATDNYGIAFCDLFVDSIYVGEMTDIGGGYFSKNFTFLAEGDTDLQARCTDEADNVSTGTLTTITVSLTERTCYLDVDGDGYGDSSNSTTTTDPSCPTGYVLNSTDFCDDNASAHTYAECNPTEPTETELPSVDMANLIKTACPGGEDFTHPCRAVYWYGTDGERHAFPNDKVYFTWFDNFDDVQTVTAAFMASLPLGDNVTYHPGTKMVKFLSVPNVYAVEQGGVLRHVTSEAIATSLYGSDWNTKIDDINDAFFSNYSFGTDIMSASDYNVFAAEASVTTIDDNF